MILCDTGPLVAAFNAADRDHDRCTAFLRESWSQLVVPSLGRHRDLPSSGGSAAAGSHRACR